MLPIYCEHFGLTREPFNVTPDPSFLYLSGSHNEALAQLVYGIKARRGFVVLTGEVGTGKTTLVQALLERISDVHTHTALLFNFVGSPQDFLRCLCQDFSLTSPQESDKDVQHYLGLLNHYLLDCYRKARNVVLIIDEAQNLSTEVLERVRLLSNFETKQEKLLQILLVGQPELGDRLNQPELRQLKQRVVLRHHLKPLTFSECNEYIDKRLELASCKVSIFTIDAIKAVHNYSGGIPRLVNILCDNGLLSAYAERKEQVQAEMIAEIAQDLYMTPFTKSAVAGRESVLRKPARAYFLHPDEKISGAADRQPEKQDDPVERKDSFPKLVIDREPADGSPQRRDATNSSKRFESTAAQSAEQFSDIVPDKLFDSMLAALTEAVGPMASIILAEHLAAMGDSKAAFPKRRLAQLIDRISREIFNESMKDHFKRVVAKEAHIATGALRAGQG